MSLLRTSSDYMERINKDNQDYARMKSLPIDMQMKEIRTENDINHVFKFIENIIVCIFISLSGLILIS